MCRGREQLDNPHKRYYIFNGSLPTDEVEARKVRTTAAWYVISNGELYWTIGDWPLLKYISQE